MPPGAIADLRFKPAAAAALMHPPKRVTSA